MEQQMTDLEELAHRVDGVLAETQKIQDLVLQSLAELAQIEQRLNDMRGGAK